MRKAGVLMPVSALPSRIGAGELGESAFHFIELLKENHVKICLLYTSDAADEL